MEYLLIIFLIMAIYSFSIWGIYLVVKKAIYDTIKQFYKEFYNEE